jgi:serine protease Do
VNSPRYLAPLLGVAVGLAIGLGALLWRSLDRDAEELVGEPPPVTQTRVESDAIAAGRASDLGGAELQDTISTSRENAIVRAAQSVSPAVVSINTVRSEPAIRRNMDLLEYMLRGPRREAGLGSGFLVDHRGYVLTAQHVIAGSQELYITLADGQRFAAEVVGQSMQFDLAVIKIQGEVRNLPIVPFGDSDSLQNGEWVLAIGSPFGYLVENSQPSVTVGVVSALHRDVRPQSGQRTYYDMIQTDAAINPGNSGGPLVNAAGEVVGINTSVIANASGGWTGLGFAVPIDRGRWVMEEILEHGRVRPYTFGLEGYFLTDEYKDRLYPGQDPPLGWTVETVILDSPADKAGILPRDVITHINGDSLADKRERGRSLYEVRVGDEMTFRVWREGKSFDAHVIPAESERG